MDVGRQNNHPAPDRDPGRLRYNNRQAISGVVLGALIIPVWSAGVVGWSWAGLWGVGLGWALMWLAAIDARTFLLPDRITLPLLGAGLAFGYVLHPALIMDHVIGAIAGYLLIWSVAAIYQALRGHSGLGLGDAKLYAAGGAWLTWQGLPTVLIIASLSGLLLALARRSFAGQDLPKDPIPLDPMPFGPPLALGIWLTWLYGPITFGFSS